MKKMIVCGDSWMTPSVSDPNTHFSEIISKELGYDLQVYARGGMSNAGICLQIESAIKQNPDLILVDTTGPDRVELQIDNDRDHFDFAVEDIVYQHPQSVSSYNLEFNQNPRLISDTLIYFLDQAASMGKYENYVDDLHLKKSAIKQWFLHVYKVDWKLKTDRWCLYSAFHQLHESKIPYVIMLDNVDIRKCCKWISEKNYLDNHRYVNDFVNNFKIKNPNMHDPGYHTPPEYQVEIANSVKNHLIKHAYN
jgi:hypothetical protein